jgi:hypothetical protein
MREWLNMRDKCLARLSKEGVIEEQVQRVRRAKWDGSKINAPIQWLNPVTAPIQ